MLYLIFFGLLLTVTESTQRCAEDEEETDCKPPCEYNCSTYLDVITKQDNRCMLCDKKNAGCICPAGRVRVSSTDKRCVYTNVCRRYMA